MIKRLIEYIILILLTIILFFLYDDEIVGMMLVMEIVYLPVSVIYINLCKLFVNVQMKNLQPVVEKNEKCSILFETSSKAFIPSVNIVLNIAVKNRFTGKSKKIKLRGKTNGKNKNEIYYDVEFNQFGSVIISFDSRSSSTRRAWTARSTTTCFPSRRRRPLSKGSRGCCRFCCRFMPRRGRARSSSPSAARAGTTEAFRSRDASRRTYRGWGTRPLKIIAI